MSSRAAKKRKQREAQHPPTIEGALRAWAEKNDRAWVDPEVPIGRVKALSEDVALKPEVLP